MRTAVCIGCRKEVLRIGDGAIGCGSFMHGRRFIGASWCSHECLRSSTLKNQSPWEAWMGAIVSPGGRVKSLTHPRCSVSECPVCEEEKRVLGMRVRVQTEPVQIRVSIKPSFSA